VRNLNCLSFMSTSIYVFLLILNYLIVADLYFRSSYSAFFKPKMEPKVQGETLSAHLRLQLSDYKTLRSSFVLNS